MTFASKPQRRTLWFILCMAAVVAVSSLSIASCGDDDGSPITSISEATESDGEAELEGFVLIVDDRARLCEVLRESFPPQCGDPSIEIANSEALDVALTTEQAVSWTDLPVALMGTVEGGVLTIG